MSKALIRDCININIREVVSKKYGEKKKYSENGGKYADNFQPACLGTLGLLRMYFKITSQFGWTNGFEILS